MSPKRSLRSAEQRKSVLKDGRKPRPKQNHSVQLVEGTSSSDEKTNSSIEETGSSDWETSSSDEEKSSIYEDDMHKTSDDETESSDEASQDKSSDDDTIEANNQRDTDDSDDERTSGIDLSGRRGSSVSEANDIEEDEPSKKSGHGSRVTGSRIMKIKIGRSNAERLENGRRIAAGDLNTNNKRPFDTDLPTETSTPSSPQQQGLMTEESAEEQPIISTQDHESSAEQGPAKRPCLESSTKSHSESPVQTPTQQQRTQQPAIQQPVTQQEVTQQPAGRSQQPTSEPSSVDPDEAYYSDKVTRHMTSRVARITANADGEFTHHLLYWDLFCRTERRPAFEQIWKAKAMDKVDQMKVSEARNHLAVQEQVWSAWKETASEQGKELGEQLTQGADAF
ncbi:hypothetical protein KCU89_g8452, partial [Aureobasidium melanogenum]